MNRCSLERSLSGCSVSHSHTTRQPVGPAGAVWQRPSRDRSRRQRVATVLLRGFASLSCFSNSATLAIRWSSSLAAELTICIITHANYSFILFTLPYTIRLDSAISLLSQQNPKSAIYRMSITFLSIVSLSQIRLL
jgi:hypothetical protein